MPADLAQLTLDATRIRERARGLEGLRAGLSCHPLAVVRTANRAAEAAGRLAMELQRLWGEAYREPRDAVTAIEQVRAGIEDLLEMSGPAGERLREADAALMVAKAALREALEPRAVAADLEGGS